MDGPSVFLSAIINQKALPLSRGSPEDLTAPQGQKAGAIREEFFPRHPSQPPLVSHWLELGHVAMPKPIMAKE